MSDEKKQPYIYPTIKPGDTLMIQRVANGWMVTLDIGKALPIWNSMVFNHMGYASGHGDAAEDCLLKFIERHFTPPTSSAVTEEK